MIKFAGVRLGVAGLLWSMTSMISFAAAEVSPAAKAKPFDYAATFKKPVSADAEWREVNEAGKNTASSKIDWAEVEKKAQEFQRKHPQDPRAVKSRKIELIAALRAEQKGGTNTKGLDARVTGFLADKSVPAAERFDVSAELKEMELSRKGKLSKSAHGAKRIENAQALIAEYPTDPRGHGYLLSIAKGQPHVEARKLAGIVIASSAPEELKQEARRLIEQRDLEDKPLSLDGFALGAYKGRVVLLYSWSAKRPETLEWAKRLSRGKKVQLVGINLDKNADNGKSLVSALAIPGVQLYDGGELDGPLARQLKLTSKSSVYLVDGAGIVRDLRGFEETAAKIARLTGTKGGAK